MKTWSGLAKPAAMPEIAERWLKLGPKLMVVTKGADGLVAFSARHPFPFGAQGHGSRYCGCWRHDQQPWHSRFAAGSGTADKSGHRRTDGRADPCGAGVRGKGSGHHGFARRGQPASRSEMGRAEMA